MNKSYNKITVEDESRLNKETRLAMTPSERMHIADILREEYIRAFLKEDERGFKRVFRAVELGKS